MTFIFSFVITIEIILLARNGSVVYGKMLLLLYLRCGRMLYARFKENCINLIRLEIIRSVVNGTRHFFLCKNTIRVFFFVVAECKLRGADEEFI